MLLPSCTTNLMPCATQERLNAPPINAKVLKAVNAMCRGVGIDRAIQSNGLKDCENLRHNLRKHMRKRQAPVARSTSTSSTAVDLSSDAEVLYDFAAKVPWRLSSRG